MLLSGKRECATRRGRIRRQHRGVATPKLVRLRDRSALPLHLVYNPNGAFLPSPQEELEADYKRELQKHFGIVFNRLYTITNLPIARFASCLRNNNQLDEYMQLLIKAFNPATIEGLMCRNTISVSWRGEVYDCDFNQMLGMQWNNGWPIFLWDVIWNHWRIAKS